MATTHRRRFLGSAALALPASMLANAPLTGSAQPPVNATRVTRIEAILIERPLSDRFWMSIFPIGGMKPAARRLILKLYTNAGVVGYGEGTGGGAQLFRQGLADLVIGEDPFMVGKVWEKLFAITYSRELAKRNWSRTDLIEAMAAIDAALYDIMSKCAGQPLYKFLGGYRTSVPAYVTGGYYREGRGIPDLVKEVQGYVEQGYNAIKLKVGGVSAGYTIEDDYERVKAVRDAVGPKVKLMLDANQGWDVSTAIQASNRMYDLDITWLEEPLHWYDDVEPLKRLKLNTRIPLASGESEITRWGARRLLETEAIDFLQFDANANGGITEWRKLAGMASMMHVWMAPHHEPHIHGHLLASVPNGYILESFANPERDPLWFELYTRRPRIEKSVLYLDDTPGLGVEFDQKTLDRYGTKLL